MITEDIEAPRCKECGDYHYGPCQERTMSAETSLDDMTTLEDGWERTTRYGRADLTVHPLVREAYKVACLIEMCGCSEALTRASSAAFALTEALSDYAKEAEFRHSVIKVAGAMLQNSLGQKS